MGSEVCRGRLRTSELTVSSARHAQLTLGVEEIQLAIRRVINQAANRAMQEPTRPAGQLQTAVAPSPKAHHPLVPQTPNATGHHDDRKHDSHRNAAELGVLAVDVSTSRRCGHRCRCRCHTTSQMQTPSWLRSVVGEHLVRYNAVPFFDKRPCDSPRCRAGTEKFIRLRLHFPSWLLRSAIHIAMSWHACGGLGAAMFLGVSRPVSFGLTWAAIRFNHLDGVRRAISIGGILPTDIDDTTGEAILAVSKRLSNNRQTGRKVCTNRYVLTTAYTPLPGPAGFEPVYRQSCRRQYLHRVLETPPAQGRHQKRTVRSRTTSRKTCMIALLC